MQPLNFKSNSLNQVLPIPLLEEENHKRNDQTNKIAFSKESLLQPHLHACIENWLVDLNPSLNSPLWCLRIIRHIYISLVSSALLWEIWWWDLLNIWINCSLWEIGCGTASPPGCYQLLNFTNKKCASVQMHICTWFSNLEFESHRIFTCM